MLKCNKACESDLKNSASPPKLHTSHKITEKIESTGSPSQRPLCFVVPASRDPFIKVKC
jgi:hypothetical protein